MLRRLFGRHPARTELVRVVVRLSDRAQPVDREGLYEEPLEDLLDEREWGEVTGGGTQLRDSGEIEACDIELQLTRCDDEVLDAIVAELEAAGAPRGSELRLPEPRPARPFGKTEGLGIYLNGTDLPEATYRDCDSNVVYDEFDRLLEGIGFVHSHWQGPTETALYVYGTSSDAMRQALQPFLDSYPLCAGARVQSIT